MAPSDVITAFLEYLVDPLLPTKASTRDIPTIFQRRSVAKQVCFFTSLIFDPTIIVIYPKINLYDLFGR